MTLTYSQQTVNHTILNKQEEFNLLKAAHAGSIHAKQELVKHNIKFVLKIAMKYRKFLKESDLNFDDLVQEGNLGLITAIDKFDFSKDCRLTTYASYWIRAKIGKKLRQIISPRDIPTLDQTIGQKDDKNSLISYKENIPDSVDLINQIETSSDVQKLNSLIDLKLTPREKHIIYWRFLSKNKKTLNELGNELECTGETIRLKQNKLIHKLRYLFESSV